MTLLRQAAPSLVHENVTPKLSVAVLAAVLLAGISAHAAPPEYAQAVLSDDPVLYYQFDEVNGDAGNAGTYGPDFDGTVFGAPERAVATAAGDGGIRFTASADYIFSGETVPVGMTGNPSFTAETIVLVRAGAVASNWAPLLNWGVAGTGNAVYFSFQRNDPFRTYAGFYNAGLMLDAQYCPDTWLHIVWTRDSAGGSNDSEQGTTLYINGRTMPLVTDPTLSPGFDDSLTIAESVFRINRSSDFTRAALFTMDEVALFDHALTPAQVDAHWQAFAGNLGDSDGDGITDPLDNCIETPNPDQRDTNDDGFGNICDADLTNDGQTNFGDLAALKADWMGTNPDADLNGDGLTNFGDLIRMKQLFQQAPGPSGLVFLCSQ